MKTGRLNLDKIMKLEVGRAYFQLQTHWIKLFFGVTLPSFSHLLSIIYTEQQQQKKL